jgi:hypothetical protein
VPSPDGRTGVGNPSHHPAPNPTRGRGGAFAGQKEKERLSGYDWRAWEKFDADKAAEEVDEEDEAAQKRRQQSIRNAEGERMNRRTYTSIYYIV